MKTQIYFDEQQANTELAPYRADAAKIKNALEVIGEIQTPAVTGIELLEYAMNAYNGIEYILKIQKVKQGYEVIRDTLKGLILGSDGQRLDLSKYQLDEAGQVKIVAEPDIIEKHTYCIESDLQGEYILKLQAFADAHNALDAFNDANNLCSIMDNGNRGNGARFEYSNINEYNTHQTITPNLKTVRDI